MAYEDRNPVWLSGGEEVDSPNGKAIRWSQPEIALYNDDPYVRMSYPDLVEDAGKYFLTETEKNIARVHEISPALVEGLWNQFNNRAPATSGLLLKLPAEGGAMPSSAVLPDLPVFTRHSTRLDYGTEDTRAGFSVDLSVQLDTLMPGAVLADNRTPEGKGFVIRTGPAGSVEILLNDGRTANSWDSGPGALTLGQRHHVGIIVDGGPKIILFVIDGKLIDGGDDRQFGWGRFSPNLQSVNGIKDLRIGRGVSALRVYGRALRTSEMIGNYRAFTTR
jgi:hypothetical protein